MVRLIGVFGCLMLAAIPAVGGYPTYYSYSYSYPQYSYSYYPAHYFNSRYYPAGNYAYYGGNYYMQGYSAPYYGQATAPYTEVKVPSYTDPNWKTEIIKAAEKRDEGALYLQAVKALGVGPPIQAPAGGSYGAPAYQAPVYPVQGQTMYGYTYETLRNSYGDLNLNTLYQQASRLAQNQQSISQQATTEFSGLVGQAGDSAARVAEVLARGAAASQTLKAAAPTGQVTEQTRTTVVGQQATPAVQPQYPMPYATNGHAQAQAAPSHGDFLASYGKPLCASCHEGKEAKGKFQISLWPSMTEEQKDAVRAWMKDTKPDSACTGNKTGALTIQQFRAFMIN